MANKNKILSNVIESRIFSIRNIQVMLDYHLAALYDVETKRINEQVKRNIRRFPTNFMFQLTKEEAENFISQNAISCSKIKTKNLKSQIATSSYGGTRKLPYAFTEQGVAMLSSVLNSDTAIDVNIKIIRIFTKMRELLLDNKDILLKLEQLERKVSKQDKKVNKHEREMEMIFSAIKELLNPTTTKREPIGFKISK